MSWERTWSLRPQRLKLERVREAALAVAQDYEGVSAEVEKDGEDLLCLFHVPGGDVRPEPFEIEVSIYDLGAEGHVISLEAEAADNNAAWEDASELAEELAEHLEARELDL